MKLRVNVKDELHSEYKHFEMDVDYSKHYSEYHEDTKTFILYDTSVSTTHDLAILQLANVVSVIHPEFIEVTELGDKYMGVK